MATFSGRNSPTALAALAPSINNLAAAKNARSQAAAGLIKTMGVQFDKQKEKEARKQKNQAAQQVAEKLLQDPAFRRQAPGITDSAGLVKLIGADNVVKFGLETQQADRVAQESATRINLTKKQIEKYETDARLAESNEASGKAFASLVGNIYGSDEFTQEDLKLGLQNLSSTDALKAVGIYNQSNPENALKIIEKDGRRVLYNTVTGRMEFMDEGASPLSREHKSQEAAVMADSSLTPEQKQARIQQLNAYYQKPRDEFGDPMPGFGGGAAGGAGGPTGVPAGGPGAGGPGGPTGGPTARITLEENSNLKTLFEKMGEDVLTDPRKVDGFLFQYRDKLSDEEKETFKKYVIQESIEREKEKRAAALAAQIEANYPDKPGFLDRVLSMLPSGVVTGGRAIYDTSPQTKEVATERRPSPQISAQSESKLSLLDRFKQFEDEATDELLNKNQPSKPPSKLSPRAEQKEMLRDRQRIFENAKEQARLELIEKYRGKDKKQILEEVENLRLENIKKLPKGSSAQSKAQRRVREFLKDFIKAPPFVKKYGIDELPSKVGGKVSDFISSVPALSQFERERRERLRERKSSLTPIE